MSKKLLSYAVCLLAVPAIVLIGSTVFRGSQSAWITICVAIMACIPFFLKFERGNASTKEMLIVAVMVSIAVAGRILCAPLAGFKPVTAVVVITAIYFGSEIGFMTGALSAVISNFYFGQGPWTPVQMFAWGLIGLIAGIISNHLKNNRIVLIGYGIISGVLFSLLMDAWSVLWWDKSFNVARYIAAVISASGFMAIYAVSNVIFLLVLKKPVGNTLERIKLKYNM